MPPFLRPSGAIRLRIGCTHGSPWATFCRPSGAEDVALSPLGPTAGERRRVCFSTSRNPRAGGGVLKHTLHERPGARSHPLGVVADGEFELPALLGVEGADAPELEHAELVDLGLEADG